jgi:hypothetical protein
MRALILAVTIAAIPATQQDTTAIAGSWTAEFNGRTFIRLELRVVSGALTGSLSTGELQVDEQGGIRQVGEAPRSPLPIFDVTHQSATVTFSRKDVHDTDRFEFRVVDDSRGELRLILTDEVRKELAADGIPLPKPIILARQTGPKL